MLRKCLLELRSLLAGRRLMQSIERNRRAADQLDALVREVLKQ